MNTYIIFSIIIVILNSYLSNRKISSLKNQIKLRDELIESNESVIEDQDGIIESQSDIIKGLDQIIYNLKKGAITSKKFFLN